MLLVVRCGHSSVPFSKTSKSGSAFISRRWSSSRQGAGGAPLVCGRSLASTAYAGSSWCAPRTGLSGAAVVGSCGAGRSQGDAGVHGGRQLKYRVVHGACLASPSTAPSSSCSAARCRSWGGHRGVSVNTLCSSFCCSRASSAGAMAQQAATWGERQCWSYGRAWLGKWQHR